MNAHFTTTSRQKGYPEHSLIFLFMGGFLFVDSLVGLIEIYLGIHLKVSLIYKSPVLLFILVVTALRDVRFFIIIMALILAFLAGPTIKLIQINDIGSFFFDITLFLKILSPLLYMKYFMIVAREKSNLLVRHGPKIIQFNYAVLVLNIILGVLGYGFSTYSGKGESEGIGVNGFFHAGNELGAVFIVLSAYLLAIAYQKSILSYLLFCFFTIAVGVLISTKTSILSAVLLSILMPVVMDRKNVFKPTLTKIIMTVITFSIITYLTVNFIGILKASGIWQRIEWFYNEYGLIRAILSGREVFVQKLIALYYQSDWYELLFGLSSATLHSYYLPLKTSAEIDPVDVLVTFGLLGLVVAIIIQFQLILSAYHFWRMDNKSVASAGFMSLILLEALAFTSGHIWLSGMLGPFLGLLISLSYINTRKHRVYMAKH